MSLESCQRWLWAAIQASSGELDPAAAPIQGHGLGVRDRVAIYANGYRLRLLECLRGEFSALQRLLGEPLFARFALDYLTAQPSTSYTLHDLGARFPEHLARTRPDAGAEREPWIDFMIDLARVERLIREVYDGPGDERLPADAPCAAARSLRLVRMSHPVQRYLTDPDSGVAAPETVHLAVLRREFLVRLEPLTPAEFGLLQRVVAGQLRAVLAEVAAGAGAEGAERWLQRNRERGLLTGGRVGPEVRSVGLRLGAVS
ncbi:MAG TPA: DNA-binding domain-containing protein [Polyangiaceae bacterium]|jgi:hypothetical protein|nr:DNA-binding domain-containing protein [Polyangiaceae bacterium]